ncbi:restriction endonuclease subunit S [Ancylobacter sp. SL191]|uniref:restriction endonuclease subunit S n=1 Tax=Ancylobacter sp. SL191 TaxID=2995166 RepID=UPI00226E9841|nr:restriction endonuclease subunit S [Ancylobacter sp. SL191]WAC28062.1 restriction endonuclease subunit S [Ancylobacter sp. SL191]
MTASNHVVHIPSEAKCWSILANWSRLDDLCDGVFDCPHTTPKLTSVGPFVVRSQDVRTGIFRLDQAGRVSEETYLERIDRAEPRPGDILFSREGTYFGNAAEVPLGIRVCLGQRMVLIRPKRSELDSRFLRFWLNSGLMARHIAGFKDGSVAERLNMPTIRALPVPRLTLDRQRTIAAILGALDDKIELNRRMNETLEAMARAIFKDWFVDFGPTRTKMALRGEDPQKENVARAPYLAPDIWSLFPDRLDDDGKPEGWTTSTIGQEVEVVGGSTPSTKEAAFWSGDIAWATPKDLSSLSTPVLLSTERKITEAGLSQIGSGLLPAGTVLLSSRAPIGYMAISQIPVAVNQGFIALICNKRLSNVFVWLWTQANMETVHQNANGSTFQEISKANFRPIELTVPAPQLLRAFDQAARPLFDRIVANDKENRTLAATRDLLLPKLMSGEIRVRDAETLVEAVA